MLTSLSVDDPVALMLPSKRPHFAVKILVLSTASSFQSADECNLSAFLLYSFFFFFNVQMHELKQWDVFRDWSSVTQENRAGIQLISSLGSGLRLKAHQEPLGRFYNQKPPPRFLLLNENWGPCFLLSLKWLFEFCREVQVRGKRLPIAALQHMLAFALFFFFP